MSSPATASPLRPSSRIATVVQLVAASKAGLSALVSAGLVVRLLSCARLRGQRGGDETARARRIDRRNCTEATPWGSVILGSDEDTVRGSGRVRGCVAPAGCSERRWSQKLNSSRRE